MINRLKYGLSFNYLSNNYEKLFNFSKRNAPKNFTYTARFSLFRDLHTSSSFRFASRLTPQEVNNMLQANEFTKDFPSGISIKSFDTNQLPSNDPIEDMRNEAFCSNNNGVVSLHDWCPANQSSRMTALTSPRYSE